MAPNSAKLQKMGLTLALVTIFSLGATAQTSCTGVLISLSPCLNYVAGSSTTPSSSCCSQLASVVQSQPRCLCSVLNGGAMSSLGITLNQTLAMSLPGACRVQTPPVSRCNDTANGPATSQGALSPVISPTSAPANTSDEAP